MADILSQSQIDDLLNELAGETEKVEKDKISINEKTIKNYDFKSPKKMSKDQYKILSSTTDILARHLSAYFAGLLRSYCEITLATIDEHPYYEYNNSLPDTLLTGVIDIDAINGTILVDVSNSISFTLVERMLGGNLDSTIIPDREFTEIEISLMERIFRKICVFIQEALSPMPNVQVELRQIETNSRFIKSIRIEEVVEVIIYNIVIGPVKGTLTICIPYTCVDSIAANVEQNNEKEKTSVTSDDVKRNMLGELSSTLVEVSAILGDASLPLREVMNLQPGDVIRLNQKIDSPVVVTVNKNKWFLGEPGIKRNYKAVKINKYYKGRSKI